MLEGLDRTVPETDLLGNTRGVVEKDLARLDSVTLVDTAEVEVVVRLLVRLATDEEHKLNDWEVEVQARSDSWRSDLLEVRLVLNNEHRGGCRGERLALRLVELNVCRLNRRLEVIIRNGGVALGGGRRGSSASE